MARSADDILTLLSQSGILSADELAELSQSVSADGADADPASVLDQLIREDRLTNYQATTMLSEDAEPLVYGDYVIEQPIGRGGMGVVYRARHRHMNRVVALKLLAPSAVQSETAKQRFYREIRAAAKLIHPNIVTAYDASEAHGNLYLVMEYVAGGTVSDRLRRDGPLPIDAALDLAKQAALGLQCAHEQGIVHRDVKPGNMLVDEDGTLKILDLGLAQLDADQGLHVTTLTQSGGLMGTTPYMAPEQAVDPRSADARADIYSLGCSLYQMITGEPPYKADTSVGMILAHREEPIPSLETSRSDTPRFIQSLLDRMMAKRPDDRFADMAEVIAALEAANEQWSRVVARRQRKAARKRTRRVTTVAATCVTVAIVGVISWLVFRPNDTSNHPQTGLEPTGPARDKAAPTAPPQMLEAPFDDNQAKAYQQAWADHLGVPVEFENSVGMTFRLLPPGTFIMGTEPAEAERIKQELEAMQLGSDIQKRYHRQALLDLPKEVPAHRVTITRPIYVATTELTQAQWLSIMQTQPWDSAYGSSVGGDYPVAGVRWFDAVEFCRILSEQEGKTYRLPSEAEWEYACRAGSTTRYYFGDDAGELPKHATFGHLLRSTSVQPAGSLSPNALGLFDMHGNAHEWCLDSYTRTYTAEPVADPVSHRPGLRALRGGSFFNLPLVVRSAKRGAQGVTHRSNATSFRVVMEVNKDDATPGVETPLGLWRQHLVHANGVPFKFGKPRKLLGASDSEPWVSADGLRIYFGSAARPGGKGGDDIWMSERPSRHDSFGPAVNVSAINSDAYEGSPRLSADELTIVFDSTRNEPDIERKQIWLATRTSTDQPFGTPRLLPAPVTVKNSSKLPCLAEGGRSLVFTSPRPGSVGANDLWIATRNDKGQWDEPQNLGPTINTPGEDFSPCLSEDGRVLVFCSDRPGTSVGHGIWITFRQRNSDPFPSAVRIGAAISELHAKGAVWPWLAADYSALYFHNVDGIYEVPITSVDWALLGHEPPQQDVLTFGDPRPLGPNVNAEKGPVHPWVSADGLTIYFVSDREGGSGEQDIWMAERPSRDQPFDPAVNVAALNSPARDAAPRLSADQLTIVFMSQRVGKGWKLWTAKRATRDAPFGPPTMLGPPINESRRDAVMPSLSNDGNTLTWFSARDGGHGGWDLWQSNRTDGDKWSEPTNLGPAINSKHNETNPSLTNDGRAIVFASYGRALHPFHWLSVRSDTDQPFGRARQLFSSPDGGGWTEDKWLASGYRALYAIKQIDGKRVLYEIPILKVDWAQLGLSDQSNELPSIDKPTPPDKAAEIQFALADQLNQPVEIENEIGIRMRLIPPGQFMLGTSDDQIDRLIETEKKMWWRSPADVYRFRAEAGEQSARIDQPFRMSATEVTVAQWKAVMGKDGLLEHADASGEEQFPAAVNWFDAREFCRRLSEREGKWYRLPTEAEWEHACRAGSADVFSFGNDPKSIGEYADVRIDAKSTGLPQAVALLKPNAWGLYDMHGNAAEWCLDLFRNGYVQGKRVFPGGVTGGHTFPFTGPTSRAFKQFVLRGGDSFHTWIDARSAARGGSVPGHVAHGMGFRVVLVPGKRPNADVLDLIEVKSLEAHADHVLNERGEPAHAREMWRRCVRILERQHGPDHISLKSPSFGIAYASQRLGDLPAAEAAFKHALWVVEAEYGKGSTATAFPLAMLGDFYKDTNQPDKAEHRYLAALDALTGVPDETTNVIARRQNLVQLYKGTKRFDDALRYQLLITRTVEKSDGPDHPFTIEQRRSLISIYKSLGRDQDAQSEQAKIPPPPFDYVIPEKDADIEAAWAAFHDRGQARIAEGDLRGAESDYRQLVALSEAIHGKDSYRTVSTHWRLAKLLSLRKKFDETEKVMRHGIQLIENDLGPQSMELPWHLQSLAVLLVEKRGRPGEGLPIAERSLRILDGHPKPNEIDAESWRRAFVSLIHVQLALSKKREAAETYERLLKLWTKTHGADNTNTIKYRNELIKLHRDLGNVDRARELDSETR